MRRGLLLALAALLPLILFAGGVSYLFLRQQQILMRTSAVHQVEQMLGSVERELFTQIELLKVLAQSPLLDDEQPNLAAFHALAERFRTQLPIWHRVILLDTSGHLLVRTGAPFGTPLPPITDEKSYQRVLETGESIIGDLAGPGPSDNGSPPRTSFRVPVIREGKIRFVLTGVVSTERLSALLTNPSLNPAWRPYIVDGSNRIAANLRMPERVGRTAMQPTIDAHQAGPAGVYEGIQQRDAIEATADALLTDSSDYKLLRRIPGIGPINALTILAEAGDLRRFGHHRQFLKFCGLDLATQQSGTFRGQTKLSKSGNARLRRTLWLAGQVAIRQHENGFRDKFERYIARDRHDADLRRKALTAITAKMARVVHAVIKTGADYRPFVEGRCQVGEPLSAEP
jgi:hypothetical protein